MRQRLEQASRMSDQGTHKGLPLLYHDFASHSSFGSTEHSSKVGAPTRGCPGFFLRTICLIFLLLLTSCTTSPSQNSQPDPRLKSFHVVSQRITILDTQAEVDGTVQNTGHDRYPYDVTLDATFYDAAGKVIGHAQGVAEDIWPGMTQAFMLVGNVDSTTYSSMAVVPTSLRERRNEKNLPSPPPVVP